MRPLISLAVIGAMALLPLTASAQHGRGGGGHASSGSSRGGSGFSGGHVGGSAPRGIPSSRGFSTPRFGGGFASRPTGSFAQPHHAFVSRPVGRFNRVGDFDHFRHFDRFPRPFIFTGGCIHGPFFGGFPCRRFFFGGSFVLGYAPLYADYSYYPDYSYSDYPPPPPSGDDYNNDNYNNNNDNDMSNEVNRLSGEVAQLRNDEQNRSRYEQSPAQPNMSAAEPSVTATLVFRDGRKLSISNYAIVGQTVWILSNNSARKIPIADLDVAATQRVNEANGVDFRLH